MSSAGTYLKTLPYNAPSWASKLSLVSILQALQITCVSHKFARLTHLLAGSVEMDAVNFRKASMLKTTLEMAGPQAKNITGPVANPAAPLHTAQPSQGRGDVHQA